MKTTDYFEYVVAKTHPESVLHREYIENALHEYHTIETEKSGNTRRYSTFQKENFICVLLFCPMVKPSKMHFLMKIIPEKTGGSNVTIHILSRNRYPFN